MTLSFLILQFDCTVSVLNAQRFDGSFTDGWLLAKSQRPKSKVGAVLADMFGGVTYGLQYSTVRLLEIEIRLSSLASQFLKCNVKSDAQPASFYL